MRLSTSTNITILDQMRNYVVPMEESVRICAAAGYRYLDANLCSSCRPGMPLTQDNWEEWAHFMRKTGDEAGISFTQAHAYFGLGLRVDENGVRSDEENDPELLMRRSVLAAEILGAKWMAVHPATVLADGTYSQSLSMKYNTEYFIRWGEFFARHHVGMAIENMISCNGRRNFATDAEELRELIERVNNPMVGACLDTGHAQLSGVNPAGAVRVLGSHLHALHIDDNHQNKDEHFAPFNGTIDWPSVMKALRDIDYQDDFAFEIHHLTSCYPAKIHKKLVEFSFELGQYLMTLGQ